MTAARRAAPPARREAPEYRRHELSPEQLVRLRARLRAVLDELANEGDYEGEDGIDVTLFTLLYAVKPA